jgi:hypothetical protein
VVCHTRNRTACGTTVEELQELQELQGLHTRAQELPLHLQELQELQELQAGVQAGVQV